MPFVPSRCGPELISRRRRCCLCKQLPDKTSRLGPLALKNHWRSSLFAVRAQHGSSKGNRDSGTSPLSKTQKSEIDRHSPFWKDMTRRELINLALTSSRASLAVVCAATILYFVVMFLIAHRVAMLSLPGHERILLLAVSVLVPDFRYSVRAYLEAVNQLKRYRPPVFPFSKVATKSSARTSVKVSAEQAGPHSSDASQEPSARELFGLEPATVEFLANFRSRIDTEIAKLDSMMSNVKRDMTRPIVETSNQIQQLVGTDLTLRKNVLVAAIAIFLSLLGCFTIVVGETVIGCVVVMIATLLPSAILAPRRHELLILINDARVILSLFGTVTSVACAFFPMTAAYLFLFVCIGLVAARAPMYGI